MKTLKNLLVLVAVTLGILFTTVSSVAQSAPSIRFPVLTNMLNYIPSGSNATLTMILGGYTTVGDGGGGIFYYAGTNSNTTNGQTIFAPTNGIGRYFRISGGGSALSSNEFSLTGITNVSVVSFTAAQASADYSITVTGAATNDAVALGPPSSYPTNFVLKGFVSAPNTVTVRVSSVTTNAATTGFTNLIRATVFHYP